MFTADLLERLVKTFAQAFAASFLMLVVGGLSGVHDVATLKALAASALLASVTAAFSAVTSVLSKPVGDKSSASLVAPAVVGATLSTTYAPTVSEPVIDHAA